jgi:hypothetical protein
MALRASGRHATCLHKTRGRGGRSRWRHCQAAKGGLAGRSGEGMTWADVHYGSQRHCVQDLGRLLGPKRGYISGVHRHDWTWKHIRQDGGTARTPDYCGWNVQSDRGTRDASYAPSLSQSRLAWFRKQLQSALRPRGSSHKRSLGSVESGATIAHPICTRPQPRGYCAGL